MKNTFMLHEQDQAKLRILKDYVLSNVEGFRSDATEAYASLPSKDRRLLSKLETPHVSAYDVLAMWQEELQPLRRILEGKRSEPAFRRMLIKHIVLGEDESQDKIDSLIRERLVEVLHTSVINLYGAQKNPPRAVIARAKALLMRPESELACLKMHYINYVLYREIALQHSVTVIDKYSSWLSRMRSARRIKVERAKTIVAENQRLHYLRTRLNSLAAMHDGLIGDLNEKGWDLMMLISLRNQYEKRIRALPLDEAASAVKRLALFEAVTTDFRTKHIEELTSISAQQSLGTTRAIADDIDSLLVRLFDLTNIQKNQLVLQMKEYREVADEHTAILHIQKHRFTLPRLTT